MNKNVLVLSVTALLAVTVKSFFEMIAMIGPGVANWFYVAISFLVVLIIIGLANKLLKQPKE